MEKKAVLEAIQYLQSHSQKRKFTQSVDLIVTFKNLDLKKPNNQLDLFVQVPHTLGQKQKVCGLVGGELVSQSKETFDFTISSDEFQKFGEKKEARKLARKYDYFVAQATVMPQIAQAFGRVLGPRQKMPNPKGGCVVPPNANLTQVRERLGRQVRVQVKTQLKFSALIGKEDMSESDLADNVMSVYNAIVHALPNEEQNVKHIYLKTTMGTPVKVGELPKEGEEEEKQEEQVNQPQPAQAKEGPKEEGEGKTAPSEEAKGDTADEAEEKPEAEPQPETTKTEGAQ